MRLRLVNTVVLVFSVLCAAAAPAGAGQADAPPAKPEAAAPAARPQPPERPQKPRPAKRAGDADEEPPVPGGQPSMVEVNVRVDATVTESRGTEVIAKKVLSVTVVNGENGAVRSKIAVPRRVAGPAGEAASPMGFTYETAPLNMDARVRVLRDNLVRVGLVLDYNGGKLETAKNQEDGDAIDQGIRQAVTVVLESGKPMVVAQSADAVGDRRVTLEVKATVLR